MEIIDDILDFIGEGWNAIVDGISYFFSFEWWGDLGEFFSNMFEGITELSIYGIVMGLVGVGTVYGLKDYMLMPFLKFYSPTGQIFWGAVTYIGTFVGGYLIGKYYENTA